MNVLIHNVILLLSALYKYYLLKVFVNYSYFHHRIAVYSFSYQDF